MQPEARRVPSVLVWLDAGNDVNDFSEDQENTLLLAAASNVSSRDENVELAGALIARGADVNLRGDGFAVGITEDMARRVREQWGELRKFMAKVGPAASLEAKIGEL